MICAPQPSQAGEQQCSPIVTGSHLLWCSTNWGERGLWGITPMPFRDRQWQHSLLPVFFYKQRWILPGYITSYFTHTWRVWHFDKSTGDSFGPASSTQELPNCNLLRQVHISLTCYIPPAGVEIWCFPTMSQTYLCGIFSLMWCFLPLLSSGSGLQHLPHFLLTKKIYMHANTAIGLNVIKLNSSEEKTSPREALKDTWQLRDI